jgi:hypothetical protein
LVVRELGYADDDSVQLGRLAADISRRAVGNIKEDQLRAVLHRGRELGCDELLTICEGLDLDPYEILYGEDGPPFRRRRAKGVRLMDVIEKPL